MKIQVTYLRIACSDLERPDNNVGYIDVFIGRDKLKYFSNVTPSSLRRAQRAQLKLMGIESEEG